MTTKVLAIGLAWIGVLGWGVVFGADRGQTVYVTETEEITVDRSAVRYLEIESPSGEFSYTADGSATQITITAEKRGGGRDRDHASEALEAIEVFSQAGGDGQYKLGWRWRDRKERNWNGSVDFRITGPPEVRLDVDVENGRIAITGLAAPVKAVSKNGHITVQTSGDTLEARTQNGSVEAVFAGQKVELGSKNGAITAQIQSIGPVGGEISTENGAIDIKVTDSPAVDLRCETRNGQVRFDSDQGSTRSVNSRSARLTLGENGPPLDVTTRNGQIRVKHGSAGL